MRPLPADDADIEWPHGAIIGGPPRRGIEVFMDDTPLIVPVGFLRLLRRLQANAPAA